MKIKCKCGKLATWIYMPSDNDWACCDDCVPRGCTCNINLKENLTFNTEEEYNILCSNPDNLIEDLDERGRKYPCCEWWYNEEGWDKDD